jgi:ketosteroid isomerase-like protein
MAHKNEELLRSVYEAFARGDIDGVLAPCAHDIVFHNPGRSKVAGDFKGRDGFVALVGKVMELSGGTFREELVDALANDHHGVAIAHHSLERSGKKHAYHTVHVWRIKGGKFIEFFEHPGDPIAFDEAWA